MIKIETNLGEIDVLFYHVFDQKNWGNREVSNVLKA